MSKYTTQVRFICETDAGLTESAGYIDVNSIIQRAIPKVFNFDFPIYDESYRNVLCTKILKHYYTKEICAETVGLWKLWLDTKLNEIMPFYNQLYKTTALEFNPLYDVDLTTSFKKTGNDEKVGLVTSDATEKVNKTVVGSVNETTEDTKNREITESETKTFTKDDTRTVSETKNKNSEESGNISSENSEVKNGSNSGQSWDKFSDTPQGALTNLENGEYLTNARLLNGSGTTQENNETTGSGTSSSTSSTNETGTVSDILKVSVNDSVEKDSTYVDSNEGSRNSSSNVTDTGNTEKTNKVDENYKVSTTEEYLQKISGKTGGVSYSKRLLEFRQTFINIDKMIIDELSDLFINLW